MDVSIYKSIHYRNGNDKINLVLSILIKVKTVVLVLEPDSLTSHALITSLPPTCMLETVFYIAIVSSCLKNLCMTKYKWSYGNIFNCGHDISWTFNVLNGSLPLLDSDTIQHETLNTKTNNFNVLIGAFMGTNRTISVEMRHNRRRKHMINPIKRQWQRTKSDLPESSSNSHQVQRVKNVPTQHGCYRLRNIKSTNVRK